MVVLKFKNKLLAYLAGGIVPIVAPHDDWNLLFIIDKSSLVRTLMRNNEKLLQLRKEFYSELGSGPKTVRQFIDEKGVEISGQDLLSLVNVAVMHSLRRGELFDVETVINDFPNQPEAGIRAAASRSRKLIAESYCPVSDLRLQEIDGHIQLGRELFRDASGIIYSAQSPRLAQKLEVKLLFACAGEIPNPLKTLKTNGHPGISRLVEYGTVEGVKFLARESTEGKSLDLLLKYPSSLTLGETVNLFLEILDAVDHCHSIGLVFRKIRSANIIISSGKPVISNFELSPTLSGLSIEESSESVDRLDFVSPVAQDLFGFGELFYEMLTGIKPFRFDKDGKYFRYPSEYREELTGELEAICLNSISDIPSNRFKSARQFSQTLERWRDSA